MDFVILLGGKQIIILQLSNFDIFSIKIIAFYENFP